MLAGRESTRIRFASAAASIAAFLQKLRGASPHAPRRATISDYLSRRFNIDEVQRFLDDPGKRKDSVRETFESFAEENGRDIFTLADYARAAGATLYEADALLGLLESGATAPDALLCRAPFATNAGYARLLEVLDAERRWLDAGGRVSPLKQTPRDILRYSPLLIAACVLLRRGARASGLADLGVDRFCLDNDQFVENAPDGRWGAFLVGAA